MKGLGLLLTPGAGADRNQAALVAIDDAALVAGIPVSRMDFPYRKSGRKSPDKPEVLLRAVVEEADAFCQRSGVPPDDLVLGGRSMGGRICSMAVADGLAARGLVLISYPLHPPGKSERLRTEHFSRVRVPCLFISGTRDAFGAQAELESATEAIPGEVTHHWLAGRDHGLRGTEAEVADLVVSWLSRLSLARRRQG